MVEEWSRIATAMNELGKGKSKGEDAAKEMMELMEVELKTVHDVMGKKWRCISTCHCTFFIHLCTHVTSMPDSRWHSNRVRLIFLPFCWIFNLVNVACS